MITLEVHRDDFAKTRFVETPTPDLAEGQVLFAVDRFALTSNNVSYAAAGDMLDYWGFFPAEEGWGRVPAMGFADVAASRHPDVAEGARYFGFYPMTSHLVVQAQGGANQFVDAAPHREKHAPAYRQYANVAGDPVHSPEREDPIILLRGLFLTSFLVDDFLADNDFFGARSFVVSSASSKTAIALAFQLSQRGRGPVIGLTSPGNAAFVEGLGCYDRVVPYGEIRSIAPGTKTVFVDHSGDGAVVDTLHRHLANDLVHSCIVGATHWSAQGRSGDLPGPEPAFFFAPTQIVKRTKEWGGDVFQQRLSAGWTRFVDFTDGWLEVVHGRGRDAVQQTWLDVLGGAAKPHQGHVLSLAG
ncbi:MAG: DUF2855 family protein [Myxococcota bacterium]